MSTALLEKLSGVKDLKRILETTVKELGDTLGAGSCQIMLSNPLDPDVTSICEYKLPNGQIESKTSLTVPLVLSGLSIGCVSLNTPEKISEDQVNSLRIALGELGDIIRQAQINDIVQRDTFRDTFLIEIGNVMSYSLGTGDALFMVVNILGKVLQVSRCLFVCTDDNKVGWKCYEYWQQDKIKSCNEYHWPTTDSAVIAQTLLSTKPVLFFEGGQNSYNTPAQEELQLIDVRSLLGVALKAGDTHLGCVILQQCDYRRAWTRNEIDMVQNVADKVAEALVKLPVEKRVREPIMQLHQRIIATKPDGSGKASIESVRDALKGALGHQAIPSARVQTAAKQTVKAPEPASATQVDRPAASSDKLAQLPAANDVSIKTTDAKAASALGELAESMTEAARAKEASPMPSLESTLEHKEKGDGSEIWGNLDAIPTPNLGPAKAGLAAAILTKGKSSGGTSPLLASFHKDKSAVAGQRKPAVSEFIAGPPLVIDEAAAQAKIDSILSSKNPTSDYVFATPGLDLRMLGRIDGWVSEIEQKDKYVGGHARQVAEYACVIGQALGLSEAEVTIIRQAALVHDLGKLGIAAQILQKKDEDLADPELITVMKHPLDGAELLESFPDLKHLAEIVRTHHEEFDGNGYPQGLKGEEIPLVARIIYLANSYHGMVSQMCYGPGMSITAAQEALKAGSGKQYDPTLVDVFIDYLSQSS